MGPILQERTASATLKKVPGKEKVRMKNAENTGIVARYVWIEQFIKITQKTNTFVNKNMCFICSNNKRGGNVNQNNKPLKKTVPLHPGQEQDPLPKAELVSKICYIKMHPVLAAVWICLHDLSKVQNGIKPKKAKSPTGATCKLRGWVVLNIWYLIYK